MQFVPTQNMSKTLRCHLAAALVSAAIGLAPASHAAITDGLVVHLPFDDTFNDATGRGNHGTPVVVEDADVVDPTLPGFVSGGAIGSHALRLTLGQYVTLGSPSDLHFGPDVDFSVAFWVKGDPGAWTSDPSFFSNKAWASGGNLGWIIAAQGNGGWKWNWRASDFGRRDTPNLAVIATGGWRHIAVTHNRQGNAVFYLDGVPIGAEIPIVDDGDIDNFDTVYNIGNDGTGGYGFNNDRGARFLDVQMDDFGVWRRALSAGEVAEIYGAGLQGYNLASTAQAGAFFQNLAPAPGAVDAPASPIIRGEIQAGASAISADSVRLLLNGTAVAAEVTQAGGVTSVRYAVPSLVPAGSVHTVRIEARDAANIEVVQEWSFTVANYQTLPASLARPLDSRGSPGLLFRSVWASFGSLANTIARAEAQLAGTLIDPATEEPYFDDAEPGPINGFYAVDVINFEQAAQNAGNFPGDQAFPGLPEMDVNNFSTEALAWLELAPGFYRLGVNSDDGFELRTGAPPRDVLDGIRIGAFDGGRGAADSLMDIVVTEAGLYPIRLIHFEGTGGASCELFSVDVATGDKILVNNLGDSRAIKAYQTSVGAPSLPFTRSVSPAPGSTGVRENDPITVTIVDGSAQVNTSGIQLRVNGVDVTPTRSRDGNVSTVNYVPSPLLPSDSQVTATVIYGDGSNTKTQSWTFTTQPPSQPPAIVGHWDFNGNLGATVGFPLEYSSAAAQAASQFGTTESFGIPGIGGQTLQVLRFAGASARDIHYTMRHNAAPNGDGRLVNLWTLILDLHFPENGSGSWFSFGQIDNLDNTNDGELFVNFADRDGDGIPDGGIGIGGQYTNVEDFETYIQRGSWHRIAFAVDKTNDNDFGEAVLSKFIDGKPFQNQLRGNTQLDGRHALRDRLLLFADEDGESQVVFVGSIQIRNYKMTDAEIAALGGPSATGIPINTAVINPPAPVDDVELAATIAGNQLTLTWTGGSGTFQVQRRAAFGEGTWTTVGTTTDRTFTTEVTGDAAFYRIAQ